MGDRTDLLALKARVDAATGPDREIDYALHQALSLTATTIPWASYYSGYVDGPELLNALDVVPRMAASSAAFYLPFYTASVDAALALIGRVLPGMGGYLLHKACLAASRDGVAWHEAAPQRIALALVSALLAALIAQEQDDGR